MNLYFIKDSTLKNYDTYVVAESHVKAIETYSKRRGSISSITIIQEDIFVQSDEDNKELA